jgi:pyruvate formate lyase activating enzyme
MIIAGLQKLTLVDYPEKLACTIFLAGCNYRCPWCYNPELVLPEKIGNDPKISKKDFFDFLKFRKNLLDGVVICGGEPTLNNDLPDLCKRIKSMGYLIKLDTNGSNPKMLKNLIDKKLIGYVAMDIKAPKEKYAQAIGLKKHSLNRLLKDIEESISILKQGTVDYEFRTTMIPKLLGKEDIIEIARWIGPAKKYCLQNFQAERDTVNPKFKGITPCLKEYLSDIQKIISPYFEICEVK